MVKKMFCGVAAITAVLSLSGCQTIGDDLDKMNPWRQQAATAAPTEQVSSNPDQGKLDDMKKALTNLVAQTDRPTEQQYRDAMTALGYSNDDIQVSQVSTPTTELPDTVQVAVKYNNNCLVSDATKDKINPVELPVLASGKCFVATYSDQVQTVAPSAASSISN